MSAVKAEEANTAPTGPEHNEKVMHAAPENADISAKWLEAYTGPKHDITDEENRQVMRRVGLAVQSSSTELFVHLPSFVAASPFPMSNLITNGGFRIKLAFSTYPCSVPATSSN